MDATATQRPRIVIVGGGFGGLWAARALAHAAVDVLLIDRRNHHVFSPLLYQVATAALSPGDIASPIRWVLRRQANLKVWLAEAISVDVAAKRLRLADGELRHARVAVAREPRRPVGVGHVLSRVQHRQRRARAGERPVRGAARHFFVSVS